MPRLFAYGSLVDPESVAQTLGRPVPEVTPVRLRGWRRRWSQVRDNLACEKSFARADGTLPRWVLGLNLEPGEDGGPASSESAPNGALIEVTGAELARLDLREIRYDRVEVGDCVDPPVAGTDFERIIAYVAKPEHFAPAPPADAVILASYAQAVESAFDSLGPDQLEGFRATTPMPAVELAGGILVRDEIPAGNPRRW